MFACNAALFLYEYLITLSDEVELVWSSKWGPATLLYYASRYTIIGEICAQMTFLFGTPGDYSCRVLSGYMIFSQGLGVLLGQGIIVLRTRAIWNDSRAVIWCLVAVAIAFLGTHLYLTVDWISKTQVVASSATHSRARGCDILSSHHGLNLGWILLCIYDVALICLTIIKYCQERAASAQLRSITFRMVPTLSNSLYRSSFVYFTIMLAFALGNLLASPLLPGGYRMLLYGTERIIYTSLACRIILDLRTVAQPSVTGMSLDLIAEDIGDGQLLCNRRRPINLRIGP